MKDARLNVRIPAALKEEAAEYAKSRGMTMSQLIVQLLSRLAARTEAAKAEVEQV